MITPDNPSQETEPRLIICRKDSHNKVSYQNKESQSLCGSLDGAICEQCPEPKDHQQASSDVVQFKNKSYTRMTVPEGSSQVTVMSERKEIAPDLDLLIVKLSKRELEIAKRIIAAHTNSRIITELVISKSTLKTHLNNIYRKSPELKTFREGLQL
jgi:DNA-binding CsgD family transcriptional regulator